MSNLMGMLTTIQSYVWGPPTLLLLIGTGLYFTIKLRGLQIAKFPFAVKTIFEKESGTGSGEGDVSAFATLCTTMAADIGTGSIVGVATALRIGGPGSLFWMWISAILGMVTKYSESLLAVKYRVTDENNQMAGGPMFYIQNGMGERFIWLAKIFSVFGICTALFGCGTFPQVNAITESVNVTFRIPIVVVGIIVTVLTAVVTIGGIKSISKVAEIVVPIMALTFLGGSVAALVINRAAVPGAFKTIFTCAFAKESVIGGTAGTGVITFMTVMRTGIARGVYTNEAGLGSSPIVAAAAKTNSGVRQGLLSMTSVFVTTILTCSMTGLVIISSGLMDSSDMNGSTLVTAAYNMCLPHNIGMYLIAVGIMFFAFTTILGWNYYGERCLVYLTGTTKWIKPYKIIYIAAIALAPFLSLEPIWLLADITNALMIIPNLIAIIALRKVIIGETKLYFSKQNEEKMSAAVKAVE